MKNKAIKLLDDTLLNVTLILNKHEYNDPEYITTLHNSTDLVLKFENAEEHVIVISHTDAIAEEEVKALNNRIENIKDLLPEMTVRQAIEQFDKIARETFNDR